MPEPWERRASLYQGRRALGGRITIDDGTFRFEPHAFDRKTGGRSFTVSLTSITSIEQTARSWKPASFSPRRCLLVQTADGVAARFLVNRLDSVVSHLREAVDQGQGS